MHSTSLIFLSGTICMVSFLVNKSKMRISILDYYTCAINIDDFPIHYFFTGFYYVETIAKDRLSTPAYVYMNFGEIVK